MPHDSLKLLVEIQMALDHIREFTAGMDLAMYRADAKCRAAVERKFEIIGEACARLRDFHPELFEKIDSASQIIGFRDRLIHGYDNIDGAIVWDVVTSKLPYLASQAEKLMEA